MHSLRELMQSFRASPTFGQPTTSTLRWVKVSGIIGIVVVLLVVINTVTGIGSLGLHTPPGGGDGGASSVADGSVEIAVTGDNFAFDPDEITVTAGDEVVIVLTSVDILHDFTIDELGIQVVAQRGETATRRFRAGRAGRYTFYCAEPGHREAGMEGILIVTAGDTPSGAGP